MTEQSPMHYNGSPALAQVVPGTDDFSHDPSLQGPDRYDLAGLLRRNMLLIGTCSCLALIAAAVVTSRLTPMYEATASLRIDEKTSQLAALSGVGSPASNMVATELEMLRGRQLAEEVADSVVFRARIRTPNTVARSSVLSGIRVQPTAVPGLRRLLRGSENQFVFLSPSGGATRKTVAPGDSVAADGVKFTLAPEAARLDLIEFEILSSDDATDQLQAATHVSRRNREAEIVDVSVRDSDPELARNAANTLVRSFIAGRQGGRQLEARSTVKFLEQQIDRVSKQLAGAERRLQRYREQQRIISLPEEASTGVTRRAELQAQRNALEAERQALDRLFRAAQSSGRANQASAYRELLAFPTLLRSGIASDLVAALTAAEERRAELTTRRTERDRDVLDLNARIGQLHQQIRSLVSTYLRGLTDQVGGLDAVLAQSDTKLRSIPAKEIRLAELERNAKGTEEIYSMLQTRLKEAEIAAAASDQSVRLVDAAILPRVPVTPKPHVTLPLAALAGALLGLAGAFVRERIDHSLHTRRELLKATGVPVLGIVPHLELKLRLPKAIGKIGRHLRSKGGEAHHAASGNGGAFLQKRPGNAHGRLARLRAKHRPEPAPVEQPVSVENVRPEVTPTAGTQNSFIFTEAHARLATNLSFVVPQPSVVLITSSLPRDGKTTISGNLGVALARAGHKVLLIDADLRSGSIARLLGIPQTPGLAEVLAGRAEPGQVLAVVGQGRSGDLHVIPAGTRTHTPAELLGSPHARELILWARGTYDAVIIDTPPITSVADVAVLAPLVDGVVLVARSGVTAREALAFAVEQLRLVRAPLLGAVLNDVDLQRDAAYDGAYEYYGRYATSQV